MTFDVKSENVSIVYSSTESSRLSYIWVESHDIFLRILEKLPQTTTNHHKPLPTTMNHYEPPRTTTNHYKTSVIICRLVFMKMNLDHKYDQWTTTKHEHFSFKDMCHRARYCNKVKLHISVNISVNSQRICSILMRGNKPMFWLKLHRLTTEAVNFCDFLCMLSISQWILNGFARNLLLTFRDDWCTFQSLSQWILNSQLTKTLILLMVIKILDNTFRSISQWILDETTTNHYKMTRTTTNDDMNHHKSQITTNHHKPWHWTMTETEWQYFETIRNCRNVSDICSCLQASLYITVCQ